MRVRQVHSMFSLEHVLPFHFSSPLPAAPILLLLLHARFTILSLNHPLNEWSDEHYSVQGDLRLHRQVCITRDEPPIMLLIHLLPIWHVRS